MIFGVSMPAIDIRRIHVSRLPIATDRAVHASRRLDHIRHSRPLSNRFAVTLQSAVQCQACIKPLSSRSHRPAWPWLALIIVAYCHCLALCRPCAGLAGARRAGALQLRPRAGEHRPVSGLGMGKSDEVYLEQLKSQGFPPVLPIDPVRYEAHQPPLYYLLPVRFFV